MRHTGGEECQVVYSQGQVDKLQDEGRESIPEMFLQLQVIVNDLKALGEKIKNDDVSYWFLMCLPPRFEMLRLLIIKGG